MSAVYGYECPICGDDSSEFEEDESTGSIVCTECGAVVHECPLEHSRNPSLRSCSAPVHVYQLYAQTSKPQLEAPAPVMKPTVCLPLLPQKRSKDDDDVSEQPATKRGGSDKPLNAPIVTDKPCAPAAAGSDIDCSAPRRYVDDIYNVLGQWGLQDNAKIRLKAFAVVNTFLSTKSRPSSSFVFSCACVAVAMQICRVKISISLMPNVMCVEDVDLTKEIDRVWKKLKGLPNDFCGRLQRA